MSPVLEKAPTSFLSEARHVLAWWLREIAQTFEGRDTTFLSLCERVLRLEYDQEQDADDVVGRAINHPIGRVTDALLRWWYRNPLEDEEALPEELNRIFAELCEPRVGAYRHGRVLLASRVITLFRVDYDWTRQHLLPLFEWKVSELEARSAWEGFLWAPQLYGPLLEVLKPAFLETANQYAALGKHGRQYASVLVYASLDPRDIFDKAELAIATEALPRDGLKEAAAALLRAIEAAGEQRAGYWKNRIAPYLRDIWPKTRVHASPAVAECMGLVCIAARDAFPTTLSQLKAWGRSTRQHRSRRWGSIRARVSRRWATRAAQANDRHEDEAGEGVGQKLLRILPGLRLGVLAKFVDRRITLGPPRPAWLGSQGRGGGSPATPGAKRPRARLKACARRCAT